MPKSKDARDGRLEHAVMLSHRDQGFEQVRVRPAQFLCRRIDLPPQLPIQRDGFRVEVRRFRIRDHLLVVSLALAVLIKDDEIIVGAMLVGRADTTEGTAGQRLILEVDRLFMQPAS